MKLFVIGTRGIPDLQGGVEKHCEEVYSRLVNYGIEVRLFARTPYFHNHNRLNVWKGIEIDYIRCPRKKNFETIYHSMVSSIIAVYRRPDWVHFHNVGSAIFIPILKIAGVKTALTYHSANYEHDKWGRFAKSYLKLAEKIAIKYADRVIVVSRSLKDALKSKHNRRKFDYIPNGIARVDIGESQILKKTNIEPQKYVLAVCRFVPEKGLHDLIEAFLMNKERNYKLVIVGDSDCQTKYSQNIKESIQNHKDIIATGVLNANDLAILYRYSSLFVLPSYHEGLPITLLEALSWHCPVIASNIAANRELLISKNRLFYAGNITMLNKKIDEFYNRSYSKLEKIQIDKMLNSQYSWDKIAKKTHDVFQALL